MEWGDESTIGFNAGGEYLANHPITGHFQSHFIACLQNISNGNLIKNEIYDLVPDPDSLIDDVVPPIHPTIGMWGDYCLGLTCVRLKFARIYKRVISKLRKVYVLHFL